MPIMMNDVEIMGDDGNFTPEFKPEMLGEEYKDFKGFENTPDIMSLLKSSADTKIDYGKKLEGVIQKPGENATDQEKEEYRNSLRKELGAPETTEAYEFPIPEGLTQNDDFTKLVKEMFLAEGVPVDSALRMSNKWNEFQLAQKKLMGDAENQQYDTEEKDFKEKHTGDNLITGCRTAAKAIIQFGDESLIKDLTEAKMMETPGDLKKWRDLGIWPSTLTFYERIGRQMKSDLAITDEGDPAKKGGGEPEKGTKEAMVADAFDHPTSKADRERRGLKY